VDPGPFPPDAIVVRAIVVRGGSVTGDQLADGCGFHLDRAGVYGFSVQVEPGRTELDLARAGSFPNKKISVTTVAQVRGLGFDVVRTPGRGFHATVIVPAAWTPADAARLAGAFLVQLNPAPRR